jgi:hypothetical protein
MSSVPQLSNEDLEKEENERQWSTPTPPNDEESAMPPNDESASNGKDPNLVDWDGEDDKENPRNWSTPYKSWITFQLGMLALAASLGTIISSEVAVLVVSMNLSVNYPWS